MNELMKKKGIGLITYGGWRWHSFLRRPCSRPPQSSFSCPWETKKTHKLLLAVSIRIPSSPIISLTLTQERGERQERWVNYMEQLKLLSWLQKGQVKYTSSLGCGFLGTGFALDFLLPIFSTRRVSGDQKLRSRKRKRAWNRRGNLGEMKKKVIKERRLIIEWRRRWWEEQNSLPLKKPGIVGVEHRRRRKIT